LVAVQGRDRALAAEARTLAARWLADRSALPADLVAAVLEIAGAAADPAFADKMRAALAKASSYDRQLLLLGLFRIDRAEGLARAAEVMTTDELTPRDFYFFRAHEPTGAARSVLFDYVRAHYAALSEKLASSSGVLLGSGRGLCDAASLKEYKDFFAERAQHMRGGPRTFALTVERIEACAAARKAAEPSLAQALRGAP
jgi:hypothetical protein